MQLPKTKEQKEFEQIVPSIVSILSELSGESRTSVFDYAIKLYNKEVIQ